MTLAAQPEVRLAASIPSLVAMSSVTTAGSAEERSVEEFSTHLSLGIGGGGGGGGGSSSRSPQQKQGIRPRTVQLFGEVLSLQNDDGDEDHDDGAHRRDPTAAAEKKKRDHSGGGARQNKKARTFHDGDDGDSRSPTSDGGGGKKKLRLTGAQAAMLDDSFRAHNILSHAEKHELARRVGLSARQVEVWFQNRRARTKLKQTEVDCELLRRWCDRLTDENARLRRDLADLRDRASATARPAVCAACCGKQVAEMA